MTSPTYRRQKVDWAQIDVELRNYEQFIASRQYQVFLYVSGGLAKRLISAACKMAGVRLIYIDPVIPWWLAPLRLIIAQNSCLFAFESHDNLSECVRLLGIGGDLTVFAVDAHDSSRLNELTKSGDKWRQTERFLRSSEAAAITEFSLNEEDTFRMAKIKEGAKAKGVIP